MTNWRTTLGGLLTTIGLAIKDQHGWLGWVGQGMTLGGPLILGLAAKDAVKQ